MTVKACYTRGTTQVQTTELDTRIKAILVRVLDLQLEPESLSDDMSLYSATIRMDSLSLLRLMTAVEEDLNIELDDEMVMDTDFTTVSSLVGLVQSVLEHETA